MILHYISAFIFSLSILTVFGIGNAAKMNNINPFIIIFYKSKIVVKTSYLCGFLTNSTL